MWQTSQERWADRGIDPSFHSQELTEDAIVMFSGELGGQEEQ